MNPKAQQIAIAEACGWKLKWQNQGGGELLDSKPKGHSWEVWSDPTGWGLDEDFEPIHPPNYCNDLNAMHEAERVLGDKWMPYARKLLEITTGCGNHMPLGFLNGATLCSAVHATAAQRAEAFLRTLNLWKE